MNVDEFEMFEAELQRLKPARPPEELVERLAVAAGEKNREQHAANGVTQIFKRLSRRFSTCWRSGSTGRPADYKLAIRQVKNLRYAGMLRWVAPGAVVVALVFGLWFKQAAKSARLTGQQPGVQARAAHKPDNLEIDRLLLGAFDAVAPLPNGEPVRFRCREWMDQVVVRDPSRGVVIEQRKPHLEIVPVGFETY